MSENNLKLKVMFHAADATGPVNAAIGFAQILAERGHDIVFVLSESSAKQAEKFGFRILPLKQEAESNEGEDGFKLSDNPAADFAKILEQTGMFSHKSSLQKYKDSFNEENSSVMDGMVCLLFHHT